MSPAAVSRSQPTSEAFAHASASFSSIFPLSLSESMEKILEFLILPAAKPASSHTLGNRKGRAGLGEGEKGGPHRSLALALELCVCLLHSTALLGYSASLRGQRGERD